MDLFTNLSIAQKCDVSILLLLASALLVAIGLIVCLKELIKELKED